MGGPPDRGNIIVIISLRPWYALSTCIIHARDPPQKDLLSDHMTRNASGGEKMHPGGRSLRPGSRVSQLKPSCERTVPRGPRLSSGLDKSAHPPQKGPSKRPHD